MQRQSLVSFIEQHARRGRDVAIAQRRGYRMVRWTYARIAATAAQFARELEARGVDRGDRVLLWGENSAEWVIAFWGCLLRGAVAVPMDSIATADFAQRVAQQVDAKLFVVSRQSPPIASAVSVLFLEDLSEIVGAHSSAPYPSPPLARTDAVEIVFTSGTTAEPKGVVISHGNLLANLEPLEREIQKYLRYERFFHPIRFLNLLPLSHVFGQLLGIFIPPLIGGTTIFLHSLGPAEVARTIRRERVSVLVTVPRLIESLRDQLERDLAEAGQLARFRDNFKAAEGESFWRHWWRFRGIHRRFGWKFWAMISGGAALPAEAESFWDRLGYAVIQGYGLTETTSLVSLNHPFRLGKGSIGRSMPGMELKLDENGEILVRGENVARSYLQGRASEAVAGEDGWFHTGDLGERDAQGNLYFRGRRKNVMVTPSGMNIYPQDLEEALRREPEVRDCVVLGLEHAGNAEPCAVLLLRDPSAEPREIVERANRSLASYQHIRHWAVWPEQDFPRTSTQKPQLRDLRAFVESKWGAASAGTPAANEPASGSFFEGALAEVLSRSAHTGGAAPAPMTREARLEADLNLSSVDRVELLSALEERFQVDLSEAQFSGATTVGEIERMIHVSEASDGSSAPATKFSYPLWSQRWPVTWIRTFIYYLLVWPATYLLAAPRVEGRARLRGVRGPILVICNHAARVDIGYVLAALPLRLRHLAVAMEGEKLRRMQHPPKELNFFVRCLERVKYRLVVALFNVFPLPQQSGFRESFAFAGESVDRGYSVLVFPEGRETRDGKMLPFRAGIGLLATRLGLPVIPMRIDGLFEVKQSGWKFARPGRIRVTIGEPVRFASDADADSVTRDLERRVAVLSKD